MSCNCSNVDPFTGLCLSGDTNPFSGFTEDVACDSITRNIHPSSACEFDIGQSDSRYKNGYFCETVYANSFRADSDIRLKTSLEKIDSPLEVISKINGYSYNWKRDNKRAYGVIAQELRQTLPELVSESAEGSLSVDYLGLVPFLLESVKELAALNSKSSN